MRRFFLAAVAVSCMTMATAVMPDTASAATLVARISLASQTMTVSENGIVLHQWQVSTARRGYVTPQGSWSAKWLSRDHRSRKYNDAPMPFAVFFNGGYAVHATFDLKRLGRPASHGCVRLHPRNAAAFFSLASQAGLRNTRIVIAD
ncbi:L,D-transpeptidase-like protein [Rhizobium sp. PP-WC-2G-219]|nr:L,D-transpeptidase-like protein [Rhizobium sp. PP-CC-3A-592]PYE44839.1 L,D-transpeptidase-like protein [Rhizobium sp. PP-F2F-G20b]TCL93996.1 L,D-transpeptidase-like protein [Rhizobium sp. PP-WC-2G-219]